MLSISPTYDVGESQGEAPCLDLEGALEALDSKYNSLLLESPCQVEQIAFEYVPLGTGDGIHVTLTPAWRFLVKQELAFSGKGGRQRNRDHGAGLLRVFQRRNRPGNCDRLGGHMRNFLHFTASGLRRTVLAPSFVGGGGGPVRAEPAERLRGDNLGGGRIPPLPTCMRWAFTPTFGCCFCCLGHPRSHAVLRRLGEPVHPLLGGPGGQGGLWGGHRGGLLPRGDGGGVCGGVALFRGAVFALSPPCPRGALSSTPG